MEKMGACLKKVVNQDIIACSFFCPKKMKFFSLSIVEMVFLSPLSENKRVTMTIIKRKEIKRPFVSM